VRPSVLDPLGGLEGLVDPAGLQRPADRRGLACPARNSRGYRRMLLRARTCHIIGSDRASPNGKINGSGAIPCLREYQVVLPRLEVLEVRPG
jgi:hypothetical protein